MAQVCCVATMNTAENSSATRREKELEKQLQCQGEEWSGMLRLHPVHAYGKARLGLISAVEAGMITWLLDPDVYERLE